VAVVTVRGLTASTLYEFKALATADDASSKTITHSIKTFPALNAPANFTFSFGSCVLRMYPRLFGGMEGYNRIYNIKPDFFMMLGDQIYIDSPLYLGPDSYPPKYRSAISDTAYQKLANSVPTFHIYDDHEIVNDYDQGPDTDLFKTAMLSWRRYTGSKNPDGLALGSSYYHFHYGDVAFFVVDTRQFRSDDSIGRDNATKTMLGSEQLNMLKEWLNVVKDSAKFKFIASSVPFTLNTNFKDRYATLLLYDIYYI
jgi:alkaline phosphatase D